MIAKVRSARETRKPVKVKDRLLDSACKLFYQDGVQAVGIDRLLKDADTAKASLYSNFGSKDALVAAYLERQAASARQRVEERVRAYEGTPASRLLKMFDFLSEWTREKDFRGCPFQNAASEITDPDHPAKAVIERQREWLVGLVRGLVHDAGVRPVEPLTQALVVLYDGAVAGSLVHRKGPGPKAARWAAERLIAESLRPDSSTH